MDSISVPFTESEDLIWDSWSKIRPGPQVMARLTGLDGKQGYVLIKVLDTNQLTPQKSQKSHQV